jgi:hypothetical protein
MFTNGVLFLREGPLRADVGLALRNTLLWIVNIGITYPRLKIWNLFLEILVSVLFEIKKLTEDESLPIPNKTCSTRFW